MISINFSSFQIWSSMYARAKNLIRNLIIEVYKVYDETIREIFMEEILLKTFLWVHSILEWGRILFM